MPRGPGPGNGRLEGRPGVVIFRAHLPIPGNFPPLVLVPHPVNGPSDEDPATPFDFDYALSRRPSCACAP